MKESRKNLYQILEINNYATQDQIKRAYKKLAILYHPDKNIEREQSSVHIFRQISQAYEVLSDVEKRKQYDLESLSNYGNSYEQKLSTFNFGDAQRVYQNFKQNLNNRYYNKGEDQISTHINGKRTQRRSTNYNFSNYSQTPHQNSKYTGQAFQNPSFNFKMQNESSRQKQTNVEENILQKNEHQSYHQDLNNDEISKSISKSIKFENGKIVNVKRTTIKKRDGTKEIFQETIENGNVLGTKVFSLGAGEGFQSRKAVQSDLDKQ